MGNPRAAECNTCHGTGIDPSRAATPLAAPGLEVYVAAMYPCPACARPHVFAADCQSVAMTPDEAVAEARVRWGPAGAIDRRGAFRCVGIQNHDGFQVRGAARTWEDAFTQADKGVVGDVLFRPSAPDKALAYDKVLAHARRRQLSEMQEMQDELQARAKMGRLQLYRDAAADALAPADCCFEIPEDAGVIVVTEADNVSAGAYVAVSVFIPAEDIEERV